MKPTLVILAAGLGSRYGGLKQLDEIGPQGEAIIDYSLYDAIRAGFGKVVFIIRKDFEEAFKNKFHHKLENKIEIEYAFQDLNDLPDGFTLPEGRTKPWGTGQAVYAARNVVNEPFAAINADDFYGQEAYQVLHDHLAKSISEGESAMVGYRLANTLSENGSVSRGVCSMNNDNALDNIVERTQIERREQGICFIDGENIETLDDDTVVSMNFWGFHQSMFKALEQDFINFLKVSGTAQKSEFYIPFHVDALIKKGEMKSTVLRSNSPWFGVTYQEDKPTVQEQLQKLIDSGAYPAKLWE